MAKIEFLYFEGCPSYKQTLEYLKEVIEEENIETNLELVLVESPEDAQKVGFQGSPSIRVNGSDLEDKTDSISFNCRLYRVEGKLTGIPSKEFIRNKLLSKIKYTI